MAKGKQTVAAASASRTDPQVDAFMGRADPWQAEFKRLRTIILDCQLTEALKWGQPCYSLDDKNVVLMHGFKGYCALLFMKGALLKDAKGLLIQQTANVQSARQIRFTQLREIVGMESVLKAYIREAMDVEKAGLKVQLKTTADYPVPEEFQRRLDKAPALKKAFGALTPGRQRGYLHYFAAPKQSKTRDARIEACVPRILDGKGMDD
jgi:uncharacterized protein YdeI (YjbR/CyaY-like superfamily)